MKNSTVEVTEDGSIIVSGNTIMSGYVADPESTAKVLQNGKIYGADLGYVDEEGLIHLTGRRGDIINVGGFKVNPVEVENAAASHPAVKDCICIAAQHPVIGIPGHSPTTPNCVEVRPPRQCQATRSTR